MRALMRRLLRVRTPPERVVEPAVAVRGLGEPPASADAADEAELDTLRGELVRELDRLAAEAGDGASFRRG